MFNTKKIILTAALICGMALGAYAQVIHIVTVADFRGFSAGALEGVKKDVKTISDFFKNSVPADQLKIHQVDGNMATPNAILNEIKNLNVNSNDTIVFYYSGHAANDSSDMGQFFQLKDKKGNPIGLSRVEVKQHLLDKKCRLTVLLTDCCNNFAEEALLEPPQESGRSRGGTAMSPFVKALFIDKEGIVDITSSKVGQFSFALKNGSLFTNAWVLVAQEMNAKMKKNKKKSLMWNEVVEKLTQKSDQLFKKHFPNGAPGGQQSQIPHAYNYPDIPPRFGVAVMTLSFGNVQITEIMPGLPGDKAGLKVGDVITHIDETEILDEPDYVKAINYAPPVINVTYLRNKKETKTRVELNGEPMPEPTEEDESAPEPVTETPQESAPAPEPETPQEPAPAPEPETPQEPAPAPEPETPQEPAPAPEPATPQEPASQPLPPYVPGVPMFGASMNSDQNIFIAIAPNSPASKAGLEVGDRLIQFNDKPIYTGKDFDAAVDASPRRAKLLIMKQEQNNTTPVTIILNKEENTSSASQYQAQAPQAQAPAPQAQAPQAQASDRPVFGASMETNSNRIIAIAPDSPAANIGLEVNDRIIKFNGMDIKTGEDFSKAVDNSPKQANLVIIDHRQNEEHTIIIELNK